MTPAAHRPLWLLRLAGIGLALGIYGIDQAFKRYVVLGLELEKLGSLYLLPFFNLTWTQNPGVSLGLFTAGSAEARWGLVAMTGAIALFVLVWLLRERKLPEIMALGAVLGGAAGNIHDRAANGFVIDYADLHFGDWRPFLIFNFADAAITIGVLIILARSLLSREKPETKAPDASGDAAAES